MKLRLSILTLIISILSIVNNAYSLSINFYPIYGKQKITPGNYYGLIGDSIQFDVIRFYISAISLYKNDLCVFKESNSYHLIDASQSKSIRLSIEVHDSVLYDNLKFNLGIDSATNNAGVMGGDLDPTNGMYWTWQSGYINFKLEGVSPRSIARKNEFQFHLGGYSFPYNSLREISIETKDTEINIGVDLKLFTDSFNLTEQTHIMSPGDAAMRLSSILAGSFKLLQP